MQLNGWFMLKVPVMLVDLLSHQCCPLHQRGALPYGGDADVRLQRPPIFSAADCLCCHQKTPHFLVKCEFFNRSHPNLDPLFFFFFFFWHSATTGRYFLFQLSSFTSLYRRYLHIHEGAWPNLHINGHS